MSWNNVDNKHKRRYDRNFVSCTEKYEKEYIIDSILEEFPSFTRSRVEAAVNECCKSVPGNHPRDKYLECLKGKLGY